ncbi:MAG: PAS domain S-box protein [Acidobacteria bacterium]|nr:PAS domain S-box protein [Acidobacteriota bacterium]
MINPKIKKDKLLEQLIETEKLLEETKDQVANLQSISQHQMQSEKKFFALMESAPDAIVIVDAKGLISIINSQTEKLFGYSRIELIDKPLEILVPHRYHNHHHHHRKNYFQDPHTRPMGSGLDLYARRKDGTEFPVEISLSPLQTEEGLLVTSIIRDVTERKRSAEALKRAHDELEKRVEERTKELSQVNQNLKLQFEELKRAEQQIREQAALLDKTQDAIIVEDMEGKIIFWNKSAESIYGWTSSEAIGQKTQKLLFEKSYPQLQEALQAVLDKKEWRGEMQNSTKLAKEIAVESRWTLVLNNQGEPQAKLIVNTDITEKKKLAAQFLRAQRMESIGTLASGIAHDLNNALTPVLMAVQILRERFSDEESLFLLNILTAGAERAADMVRQVVSFARGVEGNRVVLQPKHFINELKKILDQTFPKSIEISSFVAKDLWPVVGDATQLYQVLLNLCVNARDAMVQGGQLSIRAENIFLDENYVKMYLDGKPGQYVLITVSDTGIGIAKDTIDKIFDPFFTTKEVGKGTGLGLSTVAVIVKSHEGFIEVYSELGRGTKFKVFLPSAPQVSTPHTESRITSLMLGKGETVLVVDDELSIREITRATLNKYGYSPMVAGDGTEALAIYAKHSEEISVIIIDMMMPYLDGIATIRALQRLNPLVKVIATSGLSSDGKAGEAIACGAKSFLPKPYTAEKLLEMLADVINKN